MGKKERDREKMGIGWIKGPCEREKKKSSRSDGDRQGHEEQGGPDREREQQCYYRVSLPPGCLLPPSTWRFFCPPDYLLVFVVISATGNGNANESRRRRFAAVYFLAKPFIGRPLCLLQNPTVACRHPSPSPLLIGYAMLGDPFPLVSQA